MCDSYYLDTSIWMDYYEDRKDSKQHLGDIAFKLLCKLFASQSKIIVSSFLLKELETRYSLDEIRAMTNPFKRSMRQELVTDNHILEAKQISNSRAIPFGDVLHALLARSSGAILVTRDYHFQLLHDICEVVKPEDLI